MPTYTLKVESEYDKLRLDIFLTKILPQIPSRNFIKQLIENQNVTVDGRGVKAHYKVSCGQQVKVEVSPFEREHVEPEAIRLDIFYEDDDIAVINKPSGMLVHPARGFYTGTLVNALLHHCQNLSNVNLPSRPGIVHRLDRETSGLLVVAKTNMAHAQLAKQFEERTVKKRYVALVSGVVEFDEGLVDASLGRHPRQREKRSVISYNAKEAQTFYRVLKRSDSACLIALFPKTGRTHQLRVHMSHLGHPILGDGKYGQKKSFDRLALHAQAIGFRHPKTLHYIEFSTRIPPEFLKFMAHH